MRQVERLFQTPDSFLLRLHSVLERSVFATRFRWPIETETLQTLRFKWDIRLFLEIPRPQAFSGISAKCIQLVRPRPAALLPRRKCGELDGCRRRLQHVDG